MLDFCCASRFQAAMNDGADTGGGHIVGVIHSMFVVDGSDWCMRDGGAHRIFQSKDTSEQGPKRELLVAGGDDLQERKKLLVDGAHALVVLPGGPGTWDEVRERKLAGAVRFHPKPESHLCYVIIKQ